MRRQLWCPTCAKRMKTFLKTCQILNIGEQRLDIDIELISEKKLRKASFMYVLLLCSYWLIKCNYTDEIWNPMRNVMAYRPPASHSLPNNSIKYISHNYSHRKIRVQIEIVLFWLTWRCPRGNADIVILDQLVNQHIETYM